MVKFYNLSRLSVYTVKTVVCIVFFICPTIEIVGYDRDDGIIG